MHAINVSLLSLLVFAGAVFSRVQYDVKGFLILNQFKSGDTISRIDPLWSLDHRVCARKDYIRGWSYFLNDAIDGSTKSFALPERTIPFVHSVMLGAQYEDNEVVGLQVSQELYGGSRQIKPEYLPALITALDTALGLYDTIEPVMRLKSLYHGRFYVDFPEERWHISGAINYFKVLHTLEKINTVVIADSVLEENATDDDLFTTASAQFIVNQGLRFGPGMMMKNDLGTYRFDNVDIYLSLNGDPALKMSARQRLLIAYDLTTHYRFGHAQRDKTNGTGLGSSLYLRPLFKFSTTLFLKGMVMFDVRRETFKQWYETSLRKVWRDNSFVEFGYSGVLGTVFPGHSAQFNSSIYIGNFGLHPAVEGTFRYSSTGALQFHRLTTGLEMSLRFRWTELYTGAEYYSYNDFRPFTDRTFIYLGLRGW